MAVRFADATRAAFSPTDGPGTALVAAAGVAGLGVAAWADPASIADGPVVCPFRLATGLPCPGCGLTRSWVYLVHGDVGSSFAANWFGPLSVLAVLVLAGVVVVALAGRRPVPPLSRLVSGRVVYAVAAVWVVYAVVRAWSVARGG